MASKQSQIHTTRDQNISRILKEHYTVTYVMPIFVFLLLCVSSADVDFWVNGGWQQPNCVKTLNPEFLESLLQNMNIQSKL